MPTRQGSIHLFRIAGIDLYLHWSWFVVALFEIGQRRGSYGSLTFNVLEYLALFVIVLLHEMGHALACRSVGGRADEIVLWPLGGVAYVAPPMRPGATLWSIAAGPLVNVVLAFVFFGLGILGNIVGWAQSMPDLVVFLGVLAFVNGLLLAFNLLPIYPLDGGQIVRSLLWFAIGRARSLLVASIIGFVGVAAMLLGVAALFLAGRQQDAIWFGIMALFILANCWRGLKQAQILARAARLPRRDGFRCPSCQTAPPRGAWWTCSQCRQRFDTFETQAVCPHCGAQFAVTRCLDCGELHAMEEWRIPPPPLR
ncbi:MAG TPA: site-2 protease family protein [Opitutaceae bacterium]|nr:site-2 protease family protein [Opitutaceae bacterium]